MLLFHDVCHSSNICLLIDCSKLENGILKEIGSNVLAAFSVRFWLEKVKYSRITITNICLIALYCNTCRVPYQPRAQAASPGPNKC